MGDRKTEIDAFKRRINLSEYAAAQGYDVDHRSSSRNSVGITHGDGDKIIIGMGYDEHWVYFSVRDPADDGSIIDLDQRHNGAHSGTCANGCAPDWIRRAGPPTRCCRTTPTGFKLRGAA